MRLMFLQTVFSSLTNGNGADAVLITASTSSNEVISQAAQMSRCEEELYWLALLA